MAIKTKVTSVSTTAVALTNADTDITSKGWATLTNNSAGTVYIGGATVTTSTVYPLKQNAVLANIEIKNNEVIYGIAASAASEVVAFQTQA